MNEKEKNCVIQLLILFIFFKEPVHKLHCKILKEKYNCSGQLPFESQRYRVILAV